MTFNEAMNEVENTLLDEYDRHGTDKMNCKVTTGADKGKNTITIEYYFEPERG